MINKVSVRKQGTQHHQQYKTYRGSHVMSNHVMVTTPNKRTKQKSNYKERQLHRLGSMLLKNGFLTVEQTQELIALS